MLAQQNKTSSILKAAVAPLIAGTELNPVIALSDIRDVSYGDIACNIAMQIAKTSQKIRVN